MKNFILAVFITGLFILSAPDSYACSCIMPEVSEAFSEARAVFLGEVTEIVKPRTNDPKAPLVDRLYAVKFKVEKSWKGAASHEMVILSDQGRGGCFSWGSFFKGEKYVVYAEKPALAGLPLKSLAVLFSCNRTASLKDASEDLKNLEEMSKPSFKFYPKPLSMLQSPPAPLSIWMNPLRWKLEN